MLIKSPLTMLVNLSNISNTYSEHVLQITPLTLLIGLLNKRKCKLIIRSYCEWRCNIALRPETGKSSADIMASLALNHHDRPNCAIIFKQTFLVTRLWFVPWFDDWRHTKGGEQQQWFLGGECPLLSKLWAAEIKLTVLYMLKKRLQNFLWKTWCL